MPEHVFVENGEIVEADLVEILNLTAIGKLEWGKSRRVAAIGSNVDYSMGPIESVNRNLLEVRAGYIPDDKKSFNYVRLTDMRSLNHYVDNLPNEPLIEAGIRVLKVGMLAVSTAKGRLSGTLEHCTDCDRESGHLKLYDAAHGIQGAVMSGSERVECVCCGPSFVRC